MRPDANLRDWLVVPQHIQIARIIFKMGLNSQDVSKDTLDMNKFKRTDMQQHTINTEQDQ